ncbi:MAG: HDOD domain-containing protein [Desulfamplus sp.]|nr:HDOD domain-containing protein [Desulfamplus sp.]
MPYKKMMAKIIAKEIIDSGINIPSLPDSAQFLIDMAQTPVDKIELDLLEKTIKNDPVLFAQLLKLANSSYYSRGIPITGVRNAILRIGLTETMHSLYMYLFKKTVPVFPKLNGFSDKEYWEEAWACAVANRRLGDPALLVTALPGDLYLAGLLQGLGKLILAVYNPESFEKCIKIAQTSGKSLRDIELEIFGTTDALVANSILESWHLPENICAAVEHWHAPEFAAPEHREIAALTQFACSIVRISGLVSTCEWMEKAGTEPFYTDLSNIYIFKNNLYPLASTGKQYKLVQEIVSILEKHLTKTEEFNEKEDNQKTDFKNQTEPHQKSGVNKQMDFHEKKDFGKKIEVHQETDIRSHMSNGIDKYPTGGKTGRKKSGFFAWIRALFA